MKSQGFMKSHASSPISCVKSDVYTQGGLIADSVTGECLALCPEGRDDETICRGRSAGNEAPHEESKRMRSKLTLSLIALSGLMVLPTAGFASSAKQNDTARQEDRDRDRGDKVREMT